MCERSQMSVIVFSGPIHISSAGRLSISKTRFSPRPQQDLSNSILSDAETLPDIGPGKTTTLLCDRSHFDGMPPPPPYPTLHRSLASALHRTITPPPRRPSFLPSTLSPALDPSHRIEESSATTVAGVVRGNAFHVRVSLAQEGHEPGLRRLGLVQQRFRAYLGYRRKAHEAFLSSR